MNGRMWPPYYGSQKKEKPCCWKEISNNRATIEAAVLAKETKHSLPAICGWLLQMRQFLLLEKKISSFDYDI